MLIIYQNLLQSLIRGIMLSQPVAIKTTFFDSLLIYFCKNQRFMFNFSVKYDRSNLSIFGLIDQEKYNTIMTKSWADALQLGKYTLKNRVFLSALTRTRCNPADGVPNQLLVDYYSQRSGAGLLFTEASSWSQRGIGFPGAGCLYTPQQVEGWKRVTDAVHFKNSRIFVQLFHAGRVTHPLKTEGLEPWAPSPIVIREKIKELNNADYPVPKEMTISEIKQTQADFENSVKLAHTAGFDGISIHGAYGYLVDSFLRSHSNQRKDDYGGSASNRIRFTLELIDIALKHWQPYQVTIKLSPTSRIKDMFDSNPLETYSLLLQELSKRNIGSVEIAESAMQYNPFPSQHSPKPKEQIPDNAAALKQYFNGLIIGNYGYTPETGIKKIKEGTIDAVTFGRNYITNPDLAERMLSSRELNRKLDLNTLYGYGLPDPSKGYTDYPFAK